MVVNPLPRCLLVFTPCWVCHMHSSTYGFCELGWLGSWTAAQAHRSRWGGGSFCRAIQRCSLICLLYSELGSLSGLFFKLMWNQLFIPCLVLGDKSSVPMTLTPAFIYSSCEYLLKTYYVPESFLRARDTQQVNRTDQKALLSGDWQKKRGHERTFWGEVICCILVKVWVIEVYVFVKTCWMIPLKFMLSLSVNFATKNTKGLHTNTEFWLLICILNV